MSLGYESFDYYIFGRFVCFSIQLFHQSSVLGVQCYFTAPYNKQYGTSLMIPSMYTETYYYQGKALKGLAELWKEYCSTVHICRPNWKVFAVVNRHIGDR